jgi:putative peptidoglycan lipid II flippase
VAQEKASTVLGKQHEQIGEATWIVGVFSALMIAVGAARDVLTAASFGASDVMDAFMLAFSLSVCVYGILTSVIDTAFLPLYTERLKRQDASPSSLLFSISAATSSFLAVSTAILIVLVPHYMPLIASGFSGAKLLMTEHFCQGLLALVFLNGLAGLFKAVHNAHFRFGVPSFTNVLVPLSALIFLILFREIMGVWSLVWGTMFGTLLKLVVMGPLVVGKMRQDGFGHLKGAEIRSVLAFSSLAAPLVLGGSFARANTVVVQAIATKLPAGSVSILAYADRIFQVPVNLVALSLWTSIFPFLSREWEGGELSRFKETLAWGFRVVLIVVIPIAAVLIFGSGSLVGALFMRGAFDAKAAYSTSLVLTISGIGLVPVSLGYLFGRALHATRSMWTFAVVSLFNVTINAVGCVLLSRWWGIAGIAAAGTITFTLSTMLLAFLVRRKTGVMLARQELHLIAKIAIASVVMVCAALGLSYGIGRGNFLPPSFRVWATLLGWTIGLGIYVVCLLLFGVEEVKRAAAICAGWCRKLVGAGTCL